MIGTIDRALVRTGLLTCGCGQRHWPIWVRRLLRISPPR